MRYLSTPSSPTVRAAMSDGLVGCMTTPNQHNRIPANAWWAADNGKFGKNYVGDQAWLSWLCRMVRLYGPARCLFAVAPDVPFDAAATLACSLPWLAMIRALGLPAAFCAQDGADAPGMIPWSEFDVLFIAGSTAFKIGPVARALAAEAIDRGKTVHVGRVNSARRMRIAQQFGAASADGTFLRYGPDKNLPVVLDWLGHHDVAEQVRAGTYPPDRARHWHPRPSSRVAADDRIHAPTGYRTHYRLPGVICDEQGCEMCCHDCTCARCTGWCRCPLPPNRATKGGAVRFDDTGRLTTEGLRALGDDLAEALGPPWIHDNTGRLYWRTELVCPDDDWRISIEVAPGRRKASAAGMTPTLDGRWWSDAKKARIGFSADRDPEDIAADMRRRLFPAYADALRTERAGIAAELRKREVFAAAAARLDRHLPTAKVHRDVRLRERAYTASFTDRHGSHDRVRLSHHGDKADLKLDNVPLDVAIAVLDLVQGHAPVRDRRGGSAPRRHARRAARRRGRTPAARP